MGKLYKGMSTLTAIIIIVAITISLSIAIALWMSGLFSNIEYATRTIKLDLYSVEGYGVLVKLMIRNFGSRNVFIDQILIDDEPVNVKLAYDLNDLSNFKIYVNESITNNPFPLPIGHSAVIWAIPNKPLSPGVMYEVKVHTASGFTYVRMITAEKVVKRVEYRVSIMTFIDEPDIQGCLWVNGDMDLWVNGAKSVVVRNGQLPATSLCTLDHIFEKQLKRGKNIIAIDYKPDNPAKPYLGFFLGYRIWLFNESKWLWRELLRNNTVWKYYYSNTGSPPPVINGKKWYDPGYNDEIWHNIETPIGNYNWPSTWLSINSGSTIYFRKTIQIPNIINNIRVARITYAELRISSDDNASAYINGEEVLKDTSSHIARYWNYVVNITNYIENNIGKNITIAISVTNKGDKFYFDTEFFLSLKLVNGEIINITIPQRISVKYKILKAGEEPPPNWYSENYDDSNWSTGYLPIGVPLRVHDINYRVNTYIRNFTHILIRIRLNNVSIPRTEFDIDKNGYYTFIHKGVHGRIVVFDLVTWKYRYYKVYNTNPSCNISDPDYFVFFGKDDARGNMDDVLHNRLKPIYEGEPPILLGSSIVRAKTFTKPPTSPIVVVINPYINREFNITWININENFIDKFVMESIPNAERGLDIVFFWEDMWHGPSTNPGLDPHSWIDHVVRATWLSDGSVRIGVYRCGSPYLHILYLGTRYVYFKPHYEVWGDTFLGRPNPYNRYWTIEDHVRVFYEIGYNMKTHQVEVWASPNGFKITIWYIR